MDDYYALLKVDRNASRQEIEKRIKEELLTWMKRTRLLDLSKKQEAERKVKQLSDAREILLDDARRADYDRRLATAPPTRQPVDPTSGMGDWLDQAKRALAINDYYTAGYAAREARQYHGDSAEVWAILARANAGLGNFGDAVVEAQRAVALEPGNADNLFTLATIFEELGNFGGAVQCYEQAIQLTPHEDMPKIGLGSALLRAGDANRALHVLEAVFAEANDRALAGDYLGMALAEVAERVPRVQNGQSYVITSPVEITQMQSLLHRGLQVAMDPEVRSGLGRALAYVESCGRYQFMWQRVLSGGCLSLFLIGGAFFGGLIALSGLAAGSVGAFLFFGLVSAGCSFALYKFAFVPQWKVNAQASHSQVTYTGPPGW
ncbi:J domain-containing protein [Actinocorallia longicatena]|uniref:J domain-containing protein n=1 Tax=Actinocorallia longicatena TaxID=111803 RepID=A0ABP6QCF9_9ACTN